MVVVWNRLVILPLAWLWITRITTYVYKESLLLSSQRDSTVVGLVVSLLVVGIRAFTVIELAFGVEEDIFEDVEDTDLLLCVRKSFN